MSLITRNAKEYRSMTAQLMSQNLPIVSSSFGIFCVLRHPNHFVLAGANNRNVIITYRFLAAPVQASSETQGRSVGPGEKARKKFTSTA